MPVRKTKAKKVDLTEKRTEEIMILKDMISSLKEDTTMLEKDLREARTLLFMQMGVLLALFGLALGLLYKLL